MLIGFARVSTDAQDLENQRGALLAAGCDPDHIFTEKISGAKRDRPVLAEMLRSLRRDDVVVVTRLDRLARSTRGLLEIVDKIKDKKAGLRSLNEPWADSTTPGGEMILTIFAGIAQFERELILMRTSEGRTAAMARGVRFGRPTKISDDAWEHIGAQIRSGNLSVPQAAKLMKVNRATVFRRLAKDEECGAAA